VLHEVQENLAEARGYEIRGIAEKDVAARSGADVWIGEFIRFIVGDWLVGEAPKTLRRLDVGVTSSNCQGLERGAHHFLYDFDSVGKTVCLETDALIRVEQGFERWTFVKVGALDGNGLVWHGL
jgi:hypothetical protein